MITSTTTSWAASCRITLLGPNNTVLTYTHTTILRTKNFFFSFFLFTVWLMHICIYMYVGKRFIYWNGIEPRMCLSETDLIKELLTKFSTKAGKSWLQQQGSKHFIGKGLLMANGEDWYHQRHIVAPAFMGDRLKVY